MRLDRISPLAGRRRLRVVIETPKGSRNKYAYDPELKTIRLRKILPEGMVFPFDFGFVPCTEGQDGDPLDVLVLIETPIVPGCVVDCRLIGLLEARQVEDGRAERNDRFLAVAESSLEYSVYQDARRLPPHLAKQIETFFTNYNEAVGKEFKPLRLRGPGGAWKVLQSQLK